MAFSAKQEDEVTILGEREDREGLVGESYGGEGR